MELWCRAWQFYVVEQDVVQAGRVISYAQCSKLGSAQ